MLIRPDVILDILPNKARLGGWGKGQPGFLRAAGGKPGSWLPEESRC